MSFVSVAAVAGIGASGMSIYNGLSGSSSANGVQMAPQFNMPNMTGAANNAYNAIGNLPATDYGNRFLPQYEQATQNLYNNPYAAGAQQGSNQAGQMGQQAALNTYGAGGQVAQLGMQGVPGAQSILNTAFDPQNALYARTQQQLQEQTRAAQAARGIAMSPYGAGVENKAMSDFNIDWQNNQLGRQAQGLGAALPAFSQGMTGLQQGSGLQNAAAPLYNNASAMPYNTAQGIGQQQQQAISGLFQGGQQAQGLAQTPIQDYLSYLGTGNQAGGVANQQAQTGLNQANLGFNQNQTLGANVGAGLAGLGSQNNMNWLNSVFASNRGQTYSGNGSQSSMGGGYGGGTFT